MDTSIPADIRDLHQQLDAAEHDAALIVEGLSPEQGVTRPAPGRWCISECLDHLATANRVYLQALREPVPRARERNRRRRGPAKPGWPGRLFIYSLEPPPKFASKRKSPREARPRAAPPLADAYADFVASHAEVRSFLQENADLDLAHIRFTNPFVRVIHFSLATGLHVLIAHERRHLWQAWGVRRVIERPALVAGGAPA